MGMFLLDWFLPCFVPKVRKHLARKGLPFKVLPILNNAPGHLEPLEFNTQGVKVAYLSPNTMSVMQLLDQKVIRTFKAYFTQYYIEINAKL